MNNTLARVAVVLLPGFFAGTCTAGLVEGSAATTAAARFDIAITVDDLPFHGRLPPGATRLGIAQSYLATLKAHGVPEAFGFVNAAKFESEPGTDSVIAAWRQAGYPLGNHGYAHMNLERAPTFGAWQADVMANEPALAASMGTEDWRWLRFPHLSAGSRRDDALAWLRTRGYRVADVSADFSDWAYTEAYARCQAVGDDSAIRAMKRQYLRSVEHGIEAMKIQSMQLYGRMIPHVLLTHLSAWSAATLPEVMARLDAAGARYVALSQVQADPAYARPGGQTLFRRVAKEKGLVLSMPIEASPREPELALGELCVQRQAPKP